MDTLWFCPRKRLKQLVLPTRSAESQGPQHLAKAALLMVTNNVGSIAMLHARNAGVHSIMFTGSFLHNNKVGEDILYSSFYAPPSSLNIKFTGFQSSWTSLPSSETFTRVVLTFKARCFNSDWPQCLSSILSPFVSGHFQTAWFSLFWSFPLSPVAGFSCIHISLWLCYWMCS